MHSYPIPWQSADRVVDGLNDPLDKLENRGDGYRRRLRDGYHAEATRTPDRIRLVDAAGDRSEVASLIRREVTVRFPELA